MLVNFSNPPLGHVERTGIINDVIRRFDLLFVRQLRRHPSLHLALRRLQIDLQAAQREVERRMAAQLPDEEKIKAADYVIDNSGSLDMTERRVREIYEHLREEAERNS